MISSHILAELEEACTHLAIMDRGRLVMEGSVGEMQRETIAGLRYRIRVLDRLESALAAAEKAAPLSARGEEGCLMIEVASEAHIARINAALVAAGIGIAELRLLSNLEDAFVRVTTGEEATHGVQ
jgi:ABC-2 type transport system ATP-binding protein